MSRYSSKPCLLEVKLPYESIFLSGHQAKMVAEKNASGTPTKENAMKGSQST